MNHFCEQCGAQLREGALFCGKCGASTELQNKQIQRKKTGKKAVIISSVAVVAILVFAVTVAYLGSNRFQCKKMMRRAQESCEAEEYEDARTILRDGMQKLKDEASTQMLNDKLAEVYLAEADTCLEKEEYLSALRTVVDGRKETRSEVLTEREEYLRGHFVIVNEKEFWDDESATEHVYDKYGNEVKTVHYNSDGVIEGEEKTDSEYDEYGNVKKVQRMELMAV